MIRQIYESGHPKAHDVVLSNMAVVFDRILMDVKVINLLSSFS